MSFIANSVLVMGLTLFVVLGPGCRAAAVTPRPALPTLTPTAPASRQSSVPTRSTPSSQLTPTPVPTDAPALRTTTPDRRESEMALLHVAFQDGFEGDTVVARVNGEVVFDKDNVKTRTQIGLADSFEMNVEKGPVSIEVHLPLRNLSETIELQVSDATYVGVSIYHGRIDFRISDSRFRYL